MKFNNPRTQVISWSVSDRGFNDKATPIILSGCNDVGFFSNINKNGNISSRFKRGCRSVGSNDIGVVFLPTRFDDDGVIISQNKRLSAIGEISDRGGKRSPAISIFTSSPAIGEKQ